MTSSEGELECRVCRMGDEDDHHLYNPCLCSGSIGLVHQDCLEAWLAHSKKDTCELCFAKYQFIPQYADNTPQVIPLSVLLWSTLKIAALQWLPFAVRVLLAVLVWIGGIPLITTTIYTACMRRNVEFLTHWNWETATAGIKYGLVLDGIVALSLLILMSFTDFLRFHWGRGVNNNVRNAARHGAEVAPPAPQPPLQPNNNAPNLRNVVQEGNVVVPRRRVDHRIRRGPPLRAQLRKRREDEQRVLLQQLKELEEEIMKRTDELEPEALPSPASASPQMGLRRRKIIQPAAADQHVGSAEVAHEEEGQDHSDIDYSMDQPNLEDAARFLYHTGSLDLQQADMQHLKHLQELKEQYDKLEEMSDLLRQEEDSEDWSRAEREEPPLSPATLHQARFYLDADEHFHHTEDGSSSSDSDDEDVMPHVDGIAALPQHDDHENDDEVEEEPMVAIEEENVEENVRLLEHPGNNNNMNNLNNLDPDDIMNEFPGNNPGAGDVALELRVALLELIGVDGAFYIMFRNALYISTFISLYIFIFTFFPFLIGRNAIIVVTAVWQRLAASYPAVCEAILNYLCGTSLWKLLTAVQIMCDATPALVVYFTDFLVIGLGFTTVTSVIFSIDYMLYFIGEHVWTRVRWLSVQFHSLGLIVKIAVLLQMRIFVLPITLGSLVLTIASNHLFQFTVADWTPFMSRNAIGVVGLMWICGITFMLTMTISVLQLREVLHPAILSKWIKPQEANGDLIQSLVTESGFTHTKRIVTSLSVYIFLLALLIYTPFALYHYVLCDGLALIPRSFYHFTFYYYIPEIQIPVELLLCHICFLSVLERKKDIIGNLQYAWMTWICGRLGLHRTLLPLPILRKIRKTTRKKRVDALPVQQNTIFDDVHYNFSSEVDSVSTHPTVIVHAVEGSSDVDVVEEVLVLGRPMVRPAPGWDSRISTNASRWSWTNEEPSAVEKSVASQTFPRLFSYRLLAFLLLSWLLLLGNTLAVILLPLSIGRFFCRVLYVPSFLVHDPLNFALGLYIIDVLLSALSSLKLLQSSGVIRLVAWIITVVTYIRSFKRDVLLTGMRMLATRIATYVTFGLFLGVLSLFQLPREEGFELQSWVMSLLNPVGQLQSSSPLLVKLDDSQLVLCAAVAPLCGMIVMEALTLLLLHSRIGASCVQVLSLGAETSMVDSLLQAKVACNNVLAGMVGPVTDLQQSNLLHHLQSVESLVVIPTFDWLIIRFVLVIQSATLMLCLYVDGQLDDVLVLRYASILFVLTVCYVCVVVLPAMLFNPLRYWIGQFMKKVRDDNYLVGKRLVNTNRPNNNAAAPTAAN